MRDEFARIVGGFLFIEDGIENRVDAGLAWLRENGPAQGDEAAVLALMMIRNCARHESLGLMPERAGDQMGIKQRDQMGIKGESGRDQAGLFLDPGKFLRRSLRDGVSADITPRRNHV